MKTFEQKLDDYAKLITKVGLNIQKDQDFIITAPVSAVEFIRLIVKEAYLLLETEPYASKAKRGAVRGKHAIQYVQSIRYYYYVLNGLVVLDRPEAQHLTPLLAKTGRLGSRPGS